MPLTAAVVLGLVGGTFVYAAMSKTVTLSVDGEAARCAPSATTSATCSRARASTVRPRTTGAPARREGPIDDGNRSPSATPGAEPDRRRRRRRRTGSPPPSVDDALRPDRRCVPRRRPVRSRSSRIGRGGIELEVVTPQARHLRRRRQAARGHDDRAHRRGALAEAGVDADRTTSVKPLAGAQRTPRHARRASPASTQARSSRTESIPFGTSERNTNDMFEGETKVVRRRARPASRLRRPRSRTLDGKLVRSRTVIDRTVLRGAGRPGGAASAPRSAPEPSTRVLDRQHRLGRARRSASPAATGPSTPATATTAACSSLGTWQLRRRRLAAYPQQPAASSRSRSRSKMRDANGGGCRPWPVCGRLARSAHLTQVRQPAGRAARARPRCGHSPPGSGSARPSSSGRTSSSTPTPCGASCATADVGADDVVSRSARGSGR